MTIDWNAIQQKWRNEWDKSKIFLSDPHPNRKKHFMTVAYPYPNSPQHIGHGRTYTLTDVRARYLRMLGYNVLFPMAFHYTGTPILAMSKRLAVQDRELLDTFTDIYKVPKERLTEFDEPIKIARYFHEEIREGMREIGYSIDWRREFTTIDPQYSRFIEWQFHRLREENLITQGSHPVGWCPNCGNPVGQHDTVGDVEPEVAEFVLIKFRLGNAVLPTGTLRAETVFGVTNIWLRPNLEYVRIKVNAEEWIVSEECLEKLRYQNRTVERVGKVKGSDLVGKLVENPVTGKEIPILPASFVDPGNATGIVMSVPGHAPYDYQALDDIKQKPDELVKYGIDKRLLDSVIPISIIELPGHSDLPALDALRKYGIKSQSDPHLEEATEEIYSREFHSGHMKSNTMEYAGLTVAQAKDKMRENLLSANKADLMYEIINMPVVCRCGTECVVKMFENQWFINYGDKEWKRKAHRCLQRMNILPEELRNEFEYTVDWLREKACARRSGLGTKLPWDRDWIIESLSDSTIYMAYYTIAKHITELSITTDQLTDDVFDYVFLGKGDPNRIGEVTRIDASALKMMREEFMYFYPLDSRNSGRDLIPNHLTFFIFNHVAIFPENLWPREIVVNGSVLMEGKKMSKSLGNIIPLREAIRLYGADPLRLAILATAELQQDADFSPALAKSLQYRLERIYASALETEKREDNKLEALSHVDKWMLGRLQKAIKAATCAMDRLKVREAINSILYTLDNDIQWYSRRCASGSAATRNVLREILGVRVRLLAPFAPYICEEIWKRIGGKGFVSNSRWPEYDERLVDPMAEETEGIIRDTVEDTSNISKATGLKPKRICYYVASPWKWEIYLQALRAAEAGTLNAGQLIRESMEDPQLKGKATEVAKYTQKVAEDVSRVPSDVRKTRIQLGVIRELEALKDALDFYRREFNADIQVYSEEDLGRYDPNARSHLAQPHRPAIYVE